MTEDNTTRNGFIATILVMIIGFTTVGITGLEDTHYCESREIVAHCFQLSSTEKTCYTGPAKTAGKRCTEGWEEIPEMSVVKKQSLNTEKNYVCNEHGCVKQ